MSSHVTENLGEIIPVMDGDYTGKNLLSAHQLTAEDITRYIAEAQKFDEIISSQNGINLLPFIVGKFVMRQPSTRTAGSMHTAMLKLGGGSQVISGMESSSEAKGESTADSWLAFATQSDILGIRTEDNHGPHFAANVIAEAYDHGKLDKTVPVINLGDGSNEHVSQGLGDAYTVFKYKDMKSIDEFQSLTHTYVGDIEGYRAFHSDIIIDHRLGARVVVIESEASQLPQAYVDMLGDRLIILRSNELDDVLPETDVLTLGRTPSLPKITIDSNREEINEFRRIKQLLIDYKKWHMNRQRIQKLPEDAMYLHPRPRTTEASTDFDNDPRAKDVNQMSALIPMRMAILALAMGKSSLY